MKTGCGT